MGKNPQFHISRMPVDGEDPENGVTHFIVGCNIFAPDGEVQYVEVEVWPDEISCFWSRRTQGNKIQEQDYGGQDFTIDMTKLQPRER